jgi:asparagine synthase (glutamine-hydrolysing)
MPDAYLEWVRFLDADLQRRALPGCESAVVDGYRNIWVSSSERHPLNRLLELNLRTYLPDDLLVKADRTSMAHGLEIRSPLLDVGLIELAQRLPPALKLKGLARKRVLAAAVADLLPRSVVRRRKRGFGVPLDRWFREDLRSYVNSTLGARTSSVRQRVRPEFLDQVITEHATGRRDHGHVLWALLTLEVFLRREGW